ncbi:MAG TPA: sugar ABC transporter substrate-binding protein [Atribacter sp.]|jgi:ABC-type sugar transport system substrate-binding protein|uniref:sugar ABC transporter substrate-binding protein n=1 Tax=Atribacter sp. TaxID=2847780 RepID=UPI002C129DFF|nr:sugar ABC transporter substrate-binding protein [Atribacter sp.]HQK82798.1 sugar ABC transporter substrate-binding protein [Atribacter sp.]
MRKKLFLLVIMSLFICVLVGNVALGEEEKISIAYIGASTDLPFWITLRNEARNRANELGVEFIDLTPPSMDAQAQKNSFDNAIQMGVSGIIIGAADSRAFDDSLDKASEVGIPVVAVDTGIDHPHIASLVQTDNLSSAKIAGQYILDHMTRPGKVLIVGGVLGHQTGDARKNGVTEVLEAAGVEVIFRAADWLPEKAYEIAQNELAANPEVTAVFSAWDPGAMSVKSVVTERGQMGKIIIVGFDGDPANLKAIKEGEILATIKQDNVKMGQDSVSLLVDIINGKEVPKYIPIDGFIIDQSNVDEFLQ